MKFLSLAILRLCTSGLLERTSHCSFHAAPKSPRVSSGSWSYGQVQGHLYPTPWTFFPLKHLLLVPSQMVFSFLKLSLTQSYSLPFPLYGPSLCVPIQMRLFIELVQTGFIHILTQELRRFCPSNVPEGHCNAWRITNQQSDQTRNPTSQRWEFFYKCLTFHSPFLRKRPKTVYSTLSGFSPLRLATLTTTNWTIYLHNSY